MAHKPTGRTSASTPPQWFAWLEAPENCCFSYALLNHAKGYIDGFMTVRKERRQRGGVYWTAYRRQWPPLAQNLPRSCLGSHRNPPR